MKDARMNGQEDWPESSQTFGYVRARRRHLIHMEGFLERAQGESNAEEITNLGVSSFKINFDKMDKNLLVSMVVQLKPQRNEMINNRQLTKGPWLLVNLVGKETNISLQPAFQIYCHMYAQCQDGSKLQLLHKNDFNLKNPLDLNITSIEMDIAKLEALREQLLPAGRLTVICEMECAMYQTFDSLEDYIKTTSTSKPPAENPLSRSLMSALNNSEYSDVVLELISPNAEKQTKKNMISSKQFHCHKVILAAMSKTFAKIFNEKGSKGNTKGNPGQASIPIRDMDESTLESLLNFIYTGTIEQDAVNDKLLKAARDYQVEKLLEICMRALITGDNEEEEVDI